VVSAFISPYVEDRTMARDIIGAARFVEVYLSTDIRTCERRDAKGLYVRARRGEITDFTGVNAPYEPPRSPDVAVDAGVLTVEESVERLLAAA
jgi:adenylylsulfate kinase-like enzyme